ncbi:unnamed protein product, partial [Linum tenue]
SYAKVVVGADLVSATPNVALQKARSWDEGVSSKRTNLFYLELKNNRKICFSVPDAYTGVCSQQHVPSYKNNIDKFKAKGVDSVSCVAVNDPFIINDLVTCVLSSHLDEFYGDFDGKFHTSLELEKDLSGALLGPRSKRMVGICEDGKIKVLNFEEVPSDLKVSGG